MNKYFIVLAVFIALFECAEAKDVEENDYNCTSNGEVTYCIDGKGNPLLGKRKVPSDQGYALIENYKNGYQDGLSTYWDDDGNLKERAYFKNGLKNGMDKIYYPNRSIQVSTNYKDGVLDGKSDIYSPQGKLLGRVFYKDGYVTKGECVDDKGRRKVFTAEQISDFGYNQLVTCGAQWQQD